MLLNGSNLVNKFHEDGFLVLPSVFTPEFTSKLRRECMDIFQGVLEYLHAVGEIEFADSHRTRNKTMQLELERSSASVDRSKRSDDKYEYPLRLGMKNGYREIVMRSPGRYELVLLMDAVITTQRLGDPNDPSKYYTDGRWLLSTKALLNYAHKNQSIPSKAQQNNQPDDLTVDIHSSLNSSSNNSRNGAHNYHKYSNPVDDDTDSKSCLKQLLSWIREFPYCSDSNYNNDLGANQCHQADRLKMKQFMQLVDELLPPPPTNNCKNDRNKDNISSCTSDEGRDGSGRIEGRWSNQDYGYRLCNLSLIVATPGCTSQSWHADGGHVSLSQHEKCHVLNVFIPLVDVPLSMGPTELRPGTHYHTRNLAPMMLAAKARKSLRPPVCPELKIGDALVFDYRILHRGMANVSDVDVDNDDSQHGGGTVSAPSYERIDCNVSSGRIHSCGKDRPVLVLTFARRWFKDVCNFPKRSMFSLQKAEELM